MHFSKNYLFKISRNQTNSILKPLPLRFFLFNFISYQTSLLRWKIFPFRMLLEFFFLILFSTYLLMEARREYFGFAIKAFSLAAGPFLVKFLPIKLQKMKKKSKNPFVIIFSKVFCIINSKIKTPFVCSNEKFFTGLIRF